MSEKPLRHGAASGQGIVAQESEVAGHVLRCKPNGAKLRKLWDGYDAGELTSLFAVYLGVDSFSGAAF